MSKIVTVLYSIVAWLYVIVDSILLLIISFLAFIICYPFDKQRKVVHKISYFWSQHYFWFSPGWKIIASGLENIDKHQTYVIVSNHQSMLDIFLLYRIPKIFRWVSKKEVFRIPIVGQMLTMHGDITISRGDRASTRVMINDCEKWLKLGVNIMLFPEGTRTKTGHVNKFKDGAFLIAKMNNQPILPVVIDGGFDATNGWLISLRKKFYVKVLPPVSAEELQRLGVKGVSEHLHDLMLNEHKKLAPWRYEKTDDAQLDD